MTIYGNDGHIWRWFKDLSRRVERRRGYTTPALDNCVMCVDFYWVVLAGSAERNLQVYHSFMVKLASSSDPLEHPIYKNLLHAVMCGSDKNGI